MLSTCWSRGTSVHVRYDGLSRPRGGWRTSQECTDIVVINRYTHQYLRCRNHTGRLGRLAPLALLSVWLAQLQNLLSVRSLKPWVAILPFTACRPSFCACMQWGMRLGYNGIGMQWRFLDVYTYCIYNWNTAHDNSAPINQIIGMLTSSITNNDCKLCCLSIASVSYMVDMKLMKMASWVIKSCFSAILAPISYCPFHKGISLWQSLLDVYSVLFHLHSCSKNSLLGNKSLFKFPTCFNSW